MARNIGTVGGGELLRAVMDDLALDRKYALYNTFLGAANNPASNSQTLRATFQCRSDRWFLMTGVYPFWTNTTVSKTFQTLAGNEFIELVDMSNQARLVDNAVVRLQIGLMNESLNARLTLPEYVLWPPNALIGIEWQGKVTVSPGNALDFKCLTLEGVEYLMGG
jgi:hypothetical protein